MLTARKSIERYLRCYILAFWNDVVSESQSRVNGLPPFHPGDIPSDAYQSLQGRMPTISDTDSQEVRQVFSGSGPFSRLSEQFRGALEQSVRAKGSMIPSMRLFAVHMRVLEGVSVCMRDLLGIKTGERRQGCRRPLEIVLKECYTAEKNNSDEYRIQTLRGWRTIHAPFEERQELSCRQLWLFVMRHDDPALVDLSRLAYVAKELGFYSSRIDQFADQYSLPSQEVTTGPQSPLWIDDASVKVKQRIGSKGEGWLKRSKRAKGYLYFDFAENFGTSAAQHHLKLETVTPLVELACIYRAFFADPFSPSRHAEIPDLCQTASSDSQAVPGISHDFSPTLHDTSHSRHSSVYGSAAGEIPESEAIFGNNNGSSPLSENSFGSGTNSEYESAIEDAMPVPQDDRPLLRKCEEPQGGRIPSETGSFLDSSGDCGADQTNSCPSGYQDMTISTDLSLPSSSLLAQRGAHQPEPHESQALGLLLSTYKLLQSSVRAFLSYVNHTPSDGWVSENQNHLNHSIGYQSFDPSSPTGPGVGSRVVPQETPSPSTVAAPEMRHHGINARHPIQLVSRSAVSNLSGGAASAIRSTAVTNPSLLNSDRYIRWTEDQRRHVKTSLPTQTRPSNQTNLLIDNPGFLDLCFSQEPSNQTTKPCQSITDPQRVDWGDSNVHAAGDDRPGPFSLPSHRLEPAFVDSQKISDENMASSPKHLAEIEFTNGETKLSGRDGSRLRGPCMQVPSVSHKSTDRETGQQASPLTRRHILSRPELEAVPPAVCAGPAENINPHPLDSGNFDSYLNDPQCSSLGDIQHYDDCMRMFDASSFSDEGSEPGSGASNAAEPPTGQDTAQDSPVIELSDEPFQSRSQGKSSLLPR